MSGADSLTRLDAFFNEWHEALEARALVRFEIGHVPQDALTPAAKADAFSAQFGFQPIGFNWELLDPSDDLTAPRSARGTMVEALTSDMLKPKQRWLGVEGALNCANGFLGAFDSTALSVVSNHLNGLWYPISGASDEWSFAAMDDDCIALLVLAARG